MELLENRKFLRRLTYPVFSHFGHDFALLAEDCEYEDDAYKIIKTVRDMEDAYGSSRRNKYVEQQNMLLVTIKQAMRILSLSFLHDGDDNSLEAYRNYSMLVKSYYGRGMREFVQRVASFLESLGDMEFDGNIASTISEIRILVSRFYSTEDTKYQEYDEIKAKPTCGEYATQLYEQIAVVCSKMIVSDAENRTDHTTRANNLILKYIHDFEREYSEEKDADADAELEMQN